MNNKSPFHFPFDVPEGWFYTENDFQRFQKVNKGIYVYVLPHAFGRWVLQAYRRGNVCMCEMEARVHVDSENGFNAMEIKRLFDLGDEWLDSYGNNVDLIKENPYSISYHEGWKGRDITGKPFEYDIKATS